MDFFYLQLKGSNTYTILFAEISISSSILFLRYFLLNKMANYYNEMLYDTKSHQTAHGKWAHIVRKMKKVQT